MVPKHTRTFGFPKAERLISAREIETLFQENESFFSYPFKCIYTVTPAPVPSLQVLVSVGKKYHKRAVRRNKVRRRSKEAFRLNKRIFYDACTTGRVQAIFIYIGKQEEDFRTIENGIQKALHTLAATVSAGDDFPASAAD